MLRFIKNSSFSVILLLLTYFLALYHSILVGTSYYILLFCGVAILTLPIHKYLDKTAIWIISFSISYSLMHLALDLPLSHLPLYLLAPLLFYCFGNYMIERLHSRQAIMEFIAVTVFMFSVVTFYTCIVDISNIGLINPLRSMGRVGVEDYEMAATLYGLNVSIGLACLFPFLYIDKKRRTPLHFLLLVSFVMSLLTTIHLVNRTGLVLTLFGLILFMAYNRKSKKGIWLLLGIVLVTFIFINKSDIVSITDAYSLREQAEGGHGLTDAGNRTSKWIDALSRIFTSPFGWYKDVNYTFVHNMWLDVARLTGIIPFIAIMGITITSINNSLKLYRIKNDYLVLCVLSIITVILLESFVEPVIEGFDLYFYLLCMFWGIQRALLKPQNSLDV